MRWLGHVARLDGGRSRNESLKGKISRRRRRGRLQTEWLQRVEKNLEEIGIKEWHKRTSVRKIWWKICNQAMGLRG